MLSLYAEEDFLLIITGGLDNIRNNMSDVIGFSRNGKSGQNKFRTFDQGGSLSLQHSLENLIGGFSK